MKPLVYDALVIGIVALMVFVLARVAWSAETKCYWTTCTVIDGEASVCSSPKPGTVADMLKAEAAERGRGQMFFARVCGASCTRLARHGQENVF